MALDKKSLISDPAALRENLLGGNAENPGIPRSAPCSVPATVCRLPVPHAVWSRRARRRLFTRSLNLPGANFRNRHSRRCRRQLKFATGQGLTPRPGAGRFRHDGVGFSRDALVAARDGRRSGCRCRPWRRTGGASAHDGAFTTFCGADRRRQHLMRSNWTTPSGPHCEPAESTTHGSHLCASN